MGDTGHDEEQANMLYGWLQVIYDGVVLSTRNQQAIYAILQKIDASIEGLKVLPLDTLQTSISEAVSAGIGVNPFDRTGRIVNFRAKV